MTLPLQPEELGDGFHRQPGRYRNTGHCATYVKNNRVLGAGETNIGFLTIWQRRQQGIAPDFDVLVRSKIRVVILLVCVFTSAK